MINTNNIKLDQQHFAQYKVQNDKQLEQIKALDPTSKINIFVGANNSGKSMFMRLLSMMETFSIYPVSITIPQDEKQKLFTYIKEIIQILTHITNIEIIKTPEKTQHLINSSYLQDFLGKFPRERITDVNKNYSSYKGFFESLRSNLEILSKTDENYRFIKNHNLMDLNSKIPTLIDISQKGLEIVKEIVNDLEGKEDKSFKCVYIPVLRGLRLLEDFKDFYHDITIKDYFETSDTKPLIFTGLGFYKELKKLTNGKEESRQKILEYQEFVSENLFEGKKVVLTAYEDENGNEKTVLVKIGNESEREIHRLGDGIQSAIILTFLPFTTKEPTYFFIEEPEMYLHPGLQRKILEFFDKAEQCKNHKFFMTTHSNHFLDVTIDIKDVSIFTFKKQLQNDSDNKTVENFIVEAVDCTDQSSLELLGVRNSSVFLVNATIWVEGITDRWYLRKMLDSYMKQDGIKKLEEDVHYCFVEYGGSNITHWSFLNKEDHPIVVERLCAKAMVIVDDDGGKKEERKKELLKILTEENLIVLPCNEVENLLSDEIIKSVIAEYEEIEISKVPNLNYDDYKGKYLGKFITQQIINKLVKKNIIEKGKKKYWDESKSKTGTISDKKDFCEKALDKIEYSKLPNSTQEVVQKIYNFIVKQNS